MRTILFTLAFVIMSITNIVQAAEDIPIMNFDDGNYGEWKVEGDAFGDKPTDKTAKNFSSVFHLCLY